MWPVISTQTSLVGSGGSGQSGSVRNVGEALLWVGVVVASRSLLTVAMHEVSRPFSKKPYARGTSKTFLRTAAIGLAAVGVGVLLMSAS